MGSPPLVPLLLFSCNVMSVEHSDAFPMALQNEEGIHALAP